MANEGAGASIQDEDTSSEENLNDFGIENTEETDQQFNEQNEKVSKKRQAQANGQDYEEDDAVEQPEEGSVDDENQPQMPEEDEYLEEGEEGEGEKKDEKKDEGPENPYAKRMESQAQGQSNAPDIAEQVAKAVGEQLKPLVDKLGQVPAQQQQQSAPAGPTPFRKWQEGAGNGDESYAEYLELREKHWSQQGLGYIPSPEEEMKMRESANAPAQPAATEPAKTEAKTENKLGLVFITEAAAKQAESALRQVFSEDPAGWDALVKAQTMDYEFLPGVIATQDPKATAQAITPAIASELRALVEKGDSVALNNRIMAVGWDAAHGKTPTKQAPTKKASKKQKKDDSVPDVRGTGSTKRTGKPRTITEIAMAEAGGTGNPFGIDSV